MPPPEKLVKALCVRVVDGDTAWFEFELAGVLTANSVRFSMWTLPRRCTQSAGAVLWA